ncbi:MAG: orotidine-5'-phosphate decarboxylase [Gammaproteobacteria bacterium]|nr:orotidine-5'-phosphate decarboxylase [Gammaproteobacteria bacterium]
MTSTKATETPIPAAERLIFALDVPGAADARELVTTLGDSVSFYKLGLELFMSDGYFPLLHDLLGAGKKVFVDLKFFDVPRTVGAAVRRLDEHGACFVSVHGNDGMLKAAAREKGRQKILAVTALTSLDRGDLRDLGFRCEVGDLVLSRARRALEAGCDGVVASGLEAEALRQSLGRELLVVVPGIRPLDNDDDQKRTVNVEQAFRHGADYIVVGRPIREAADPRAAAQDIQRRIAALFA